MKHVLPAALHPRNIARRRILNYSRGRVVSGPFAGQVYITSDSDFIDPSMLMGTYELELHPVLRGVIANPPSKFIDVGASQGYYTVGFGRLAPQARHIAFEMYGPRIEQLRRTAEANRVLFELHGECTPEGLQRALQPDGDAFVLIDIDGAEYGLADPVKVPLLRFARLLIETHDHIAPGTTEELRRRFTATHAIREFESQPRTKTDLPFIVCDQWTLRQIDEGRGVTQIWLFMQPRAE